MNPEFTGERFLPDNSLDAEIAIEHMQRYNFAKKFVKDKCVLDAACGEGYGSKMLSECAKSVVGIDVDETAVSQAKEKYKANQLSFVVGTIAKLPFEDNSFDVVYFDPMFVRPLQKSSGIAGLRAAADYYQPTAEDFNQAKRVAAQRVVVKHGKGQMAQTAFDEVICGRYSTIGYGLFYAEKGGGQ